jgi:cytoskeletal protein RodZ
MRRPPAPGPTDARRQAAAQRLAERRRRARTIRKWVIGMGVAVFLAVWALIFANVVTGNDPALSKSTAAAASTQSSASSGSSSSASTGSTRSGSTDSGSGSSGSGSSSSGQSSSSSPSSVTTSQS